LIKSFSFFFILIYSAALWPACDKLQAYFISGSYDRCTKESATISEPACFYLKGLCFVGMGDYEQARFIMADLAAARTDVNDFYPNLALASMAELSFLQNDFTKAEALAEETNTTLSKNNFASYPHAVSELLIIKSCYEQKNILSAARRIDMLRNLNTDGIIFESVKY
jgi:hypothetical protein